MQITINTADILGDETTIRDEVIEQVSNSLLQEMRKRADSIIKETLEKALVETVKEKVAAIIGSQIDTEFVPVSEYGAREKPTTIRNRIAAELQHQCSFKRTTYRSDMNAFSQAVMEVVEKELTKFKQEFNSLVNTTLIQQCMNEAAAKLKAACGIK